MNARRLAYLFVIAIPWVMGLSSFGAEGIRISDSIGEIRHTGVIWIATFYVGLALMMLPRGDVPITFPWYLWMPFFMASLTSLVWSDLGPDNLKLGVQMLVYPICGMVASFAITSTRSLEKMNWMFLVNMAFIGAICIYYVGLSSIDLQTDEGKYQGFAERPAGASLMFLGCYFLAQSKSRPLLAVFGWGAALFFCLISGGRMATALTLVCGLMSPCFKIRHRLMLVGLIVIGVIGLFNTPIIQSRFFNSETGHGGSGKLEDVAAGEFDGSGRFEAWPRIYKEANRAPVFGHGLGNSIYYTYKVWPPMDKPHNEYLKVYFDSGGVGFACFLISMLSSIAGLYWVFHKSARLGVHNWPAAAAIMGMWCFAGLATVDNPLVYGNNFLHPLFAVIGISYGILHQEERRERGEIEIPEGEESARVDAVV